MAYVDKMGTDANQRNKLEPFSFTLSILNQSCHYTSKAGEYWASFLIYNIDHQQLLVMDIVGQLGKEELQEITIIAFHKYYFHSKKSRFRQTNLWKHSDW